MVEEEYNQYGLRGGFLDLVQGVLGKNKRALARAITLIENEASGKNELLQSLFPYTGNSYVVGFTGSSGSGKSSLVDKVTEHVRKQGFSVGIIAVDPSSPFSGGALLGDRIRMESHILDDDVYIRSMSTRGTMGGLSRAVKDAVKVLDAYGKDYIFIETVGVGQSELDVMHYSDTVLVILSPGAGDVIQTLKAGIMEIADIFVVNKSDIPNADKTFNDVKSMLNFLDEGEWKTPVIKTTTISGDGISELCNAILEHKAYLEEDGLNEIRNQRLRHEILEIALEEMSRELREDINAGRLYDDLLRKVESREMHPVLAAEELILYLKNKR